MSGRLPAVAGEATVHVVAPAGPVAGEALDAGIETLASWRLRPRLGQHARARQGYLAGSDEERAQDLRDAFTGSGERAVVWYARGGYGTTRLLRLLALDEMSACDRLLVGYSDATALGLALSRRRPQPMLYGPGVAELGGAGDGADLESLRRGLFGEHPGARQTLAGLSPVLPGRAAGVVMGGCLSLLASMVGTPWLPSLRGRLLFLEDVNEEPYRLDRMLTQLAAAGAVDGVAGVMLGRFHRCEPRPGSDSPQASRVLADWASGLGVPVISGLPAGHGPGKVTIPLGVAAEIDAEAGSVTFLHG